MNMFELVANLFSKLSLVLAQLLYPYIEDEVTQNSFKDDSRQGYLKIIKKAYQEGAQGVILGCTEMDSSSSSQIARRYLCLIL